MMEAMEGWREHWRENWWQEQLAAAILRIAIVSGVMIFFVYGGLRIFLRNAYGIQIWNPFG